MARISPGGEGMKRRLMIGVAGLAAVAALVLGARAVAYGERGWRPLHAAEFEAEACELYHVMRGLEQDPAQDPANAALVERCRPPSQGRRSPPRRSRRRATPFS